MAQETSLSKVVLSRLMDVRIKKEIGDCDGRRRASGRENRKRNRADLRLRWGVALPMKQYSQKECGGTETARYQRA